MKVRETFAGLALSALLLGACGQGDDGDMQEETPDSPAPGIEEETADAEDSDSAEDENTNDSEGDADGEASNPEDVESLPFGGGVIGGNVELSYPDGEAGEVSIVGEYLRFDGGYMHLVFRNNTDETIGKVRFDARSLVDGEKFIDGRSQNIIPAHIEPGGIGVAYIYYPASHTIPEDAEYEYEVEWRVEGDDRFFDRQDFTVTETELVEGEIAGSAVNNSDLEIDIPVDVEILCFEGTDIVEMYTARTLEPAGIVGPGESVTFSWPTIYGPCEDYAVSVIGDTD